MPIITDDIFTDDFESGDPLPSTSGGNYTVTGFGTPTAANGVGNGGGWGVHCTGLSVQGGRIRNTSAFTPSGNTGCVQADFWLSADGLTAVGDPYWIRVKSASGVGQIVGIGFSGASAPYDILVINQTGTIATLADAMPGGEWATVRVAFTMSSDALTSDGSLQVWVGPDEDNLTSVYENFALAAAYATEWAYVDWTIDYEGFLDNIKVGNGGDESPAQIVGSAVFGVNTTVKATRAIAFGLDDATNEHDEAGKFKVFGKADITDVVGTFRGMAVLDADPTSPDEQTWWARHGGTSPDTVEIRARLDGVTSTINGGGSLADDSVTNAKLANMAEATIKGRAVGAGTGDPTDLTATQATAILNNVVGDSGSGGTKGLAPAPSAGDAAAGKFLSADGTYQVPSGTGTGGANAIHTTTFASPPGSPTSGDLLLYSDGFYVARYTGSVWAPWGPVFPFTDPSLASISTWVNQGTSTVDSTFGGIALTPQSVNGSNSVRMRVKSAPSTPYVITAAFTACALNGGANASGWGLCWRESGTGEIITAGIQMNSSGQLRAFGFDWASPTDGAPVSNYSLLISAQSGVVFQRIADNGTNRITSISFDGQHWIQLQSETRTTHLTADQVGIFAYQATTGAPDLIMTLFHWKET